MGIWVPYACGYFNKVFYVQLFFICVEKSKDVFLSLNENSVFQGGSERLGKVPPFVGVCSNTLEIYLVSF